MTLRPARASDARRIWNWANDPGARRASTRSGRIPWATHRRWFRDRLSIPEASRIYILLDPEPVAQVRFERSGAGTAILSIVVDPAARRRGVATRALRLACPRAVKDLGLRRIWAYVKKTNSASIALFRKAAFRRIRTDPRNGVEVALFSKSFRSP
jgi:RimJ/RimL family protein N-acetyltransferase